MGVAYETNANSTGNTGVATFAGQAIGSAAADRWVIVAARSNGNGITGITCGGVPMTFESPAGGAAAVAFGYLLVPSGTTATIAVADTGVGFACSIAIWSVSGLGDPSLFSSDAGTGSGTSSVATATIDTALGGFVIAYGGCGDGNDAASGVLSASGISITTDVMTNNWDNHRGAIGGSNGSTGATSASTVTATYTSGQATGSGLAAVAFEFATPPGTPSVDTDAATDVTHVTATLNGEITDVGSGDADHRGFVFGTTTQSAPGDVAPSSSGYDDFSDETGTFSADTFDDDLVGLSPSTTYYVRAWAHNGDGYAYGDEISFDTDAPPPFRFTNLPGVDFDPADTCTIYAERLNDILERIEALEA